MHFCSAPVCSFLTENLCIKHNLFLWLAYYPDYHHPANQSIFNNNGICECNIYIVISGNYYDDHQRHLIFPHYIINHTQSRKKNIFMIIKEYLYNDVRSDDL